jgi:hypothetical protein
VELKVMMRRRDGERKLHAPIDDEYGLDRIDAMIADIKAEYDAKLGIVIAVDDANEYHGDISEGF